MKVFKSLAPLPRDIKKGTIFLAMEEPNSVENSSVMYGFMLLPTGEIKNIWWYPREVESL